MWELLLLSESCDPNLIVEFLEYYSVALADFHLNALLRRRVNPG